MARTGHVIASSIVDVDVISPHESDRISTMVMAWLNARSAEGARAVRERYSSC